MHERQCSTEVIPLAISTDSRQFNSHAWRKSARARPALSHACEWDAMYICSGGYTGSTVLKCSSPRVSEKICRERRHVKVCTHVYMLHGEKKPGGHDHGVFTSMCMLPVCVQYKCVTDNSIQISVSAELSVPELMLESRLGC